MDGAYTESGEYVYGEFYMYSDKYGEADGVYTESGEYVYGECYRYSGRYCEMDGAYTESGEYVYGECYIYWFKNVLPVQELFLLDGILILTIILDP